MARKTGAPKSSTRHSDHVRPVNAVVEVGDQPVDIGVRIGLEWGPPDVVGTERPELAESGRRVESKPVRNNQRTGPQNADQKLAKAEGEHLRVCGFRWWRQWHTNRV